MDVYTGNFIRRIQAHTSTINTIDLNDEGTVLISGSYDQTACLWDLRSNARDPIQTLSDCKDSVTCVTHTDSLIIVGSLDKCLRIYDIRKGLYYTDDLTQPITSLRLSYDNKTILASCLGNNLSLLAIDSGQMLNNYTGYHIHQSYKLEACFANDDQHILTCSEDGSIVHHNILTGICIRHTKQAHKGPISGICYHPKNEHMFVTSAYDGTAKVWGSDPYRV